MNLNGYFYLIVIITFFLIARGNNFGSVVISFFSFICLLTVYIWYMDVKLLALSTLLWYGGGLSAIFVIWSQFTSTRQFESFVLNFC